jgi:DNA-3-methyladenine glycosylase I
MREAAIERCAWSVGIDPEYEQYHDTEWGVPVRDDRQHFEFLVLEAAQAGLSWWTVLRKRAGYRRAFADFDAAAVARFDARKVERLMQDASIVRNRQKIEAAIANARAFLEVQEEFGSFDRYVWPFVGGQPIVNRRRRQTDVPATSKESDALSKDLKARCFKFVGSTIVYAHMQADRARQRSRRELLPVRDLLRSVAQDDFRAQPSALTRTQLDTRLRTSARECDPFRGSPHRSEDRSALAGDHRDR